jgi:hypothetical protein
MKIIVCGPGDAEKVLLSFEIQRRQSSVAPIYSVYTK